MTLSTLLILALLILGCPGPVSSPVEAQASVRGQAGSRIRAPDEPPGEESAKTLPRGRRKRLICRVVQKDASAWSGAHVRFVSWPAWNYPGLGSFDDLQAVADERGRVTVRGLLHRRYYVWAWQALGDDRYRISEPARFVAPGQPFILRERSFTVPRQRITVDVENWSRLGPFRIALRQNPFFGTYSASVAKELDLLPWIPTDLSAGEEVELPVLPWRRVRVEVLGKGGLLLFQQSIPLEGPGASSAPRRLSAGKGELRHIRFYLDEALTKRARDYKLYQRYLGRLIELGGVDENGQGRILLPTRPRKIYDNFWFERNPFYVGRQEGRAEASDYNLTRMTRIAGGKGMPIRGGMGVLRDGRCLNLVVNAPDGKPIAGLPVLIWEKERRSRLRRMVHVLSGTAVETDREGRVDYPWFGWGEYAVFAILPDELLDRLMGESKLPIHPMVLLRTGYGLDLKQGELSTISIGDLRRVEFSIDWNKELVTQSPVVHLFDKQADTFGYTRLLRLPCDRRGRAVTLLPPARELRYMARSVLGVLTGVVSTGAKGAGLVEISDRIPDAIAISGRIHDAQGRPVVSAAINLANPWFRARAQHPLLRFDLSRICTQVDEDGRFRFFQQQVQAPLQLYVQPYRGEQALRRSVHNLDVDGKLEGLDIEVEGLDDSAGGGKGVPQPRIRRLPVQKK